MGRTVGALVLAGMVLVAALPLRALAAPGAQVLPHQVYPVQLSPRSRADISVPDGVWDRPGKLFVLPVFVVASDRGQYAQNPASPGHDFNGSPISPALGAQFDRATANMGAHLQMARRMYYRMLRNPLNDKPRGTFRLASWNHATGRAREVSDYQDDVTPLVLKIADSAGSIASQLDSGILSFIDDVMDPLGCRQTSCPFVLMMVIVADAGIGTGGYKFNQGFDAGAGFVVFDWEDVRDANRGDDQCLDLPRLVGRPPADNWVGNGCRHFQSTLVHEIGHAYGLNHSWEYGGTGSYYGKDTSASIMSYNVANWIPGCGPGNSAPDPDTPCRYPSSHTTIDDNATDWPGRLLADDMRVLGRNRQGFSGIDYARALDTPTGIEPVLHQTYHGYAEIPGQERLVFVPTLTQSGWADAIVGGGSEAILQAWERWNPVRGWTVGPFGAGLTSAFQVIFPGPVQLTAVRFYSGHGGETHVPGVFYNVPREARVGCSGCLDGGFDRLGFTTFHSGLNQTAALINHTPTDTYRIDLVHGTEQYVTLRGVRFWGRIGGTGPEVELFAAGEPEATTAFSTYDGDVSSVVGSNQTIKAFGDSFSPADSWHSQAVTCGNWVSVEVEFPDDVDLGYVKTHTGHSGQYHVPDQVQVERECVCRANNTGVGGICAHDLSAAACVAAGGPGHRVFEFVTRAAADADHLTGFATRSAHRWKIALHTPDTGQQCYVVVRGLRFFNADGHEWFPARTRPPGE